MFQVAAAAAVAWDYDFDLTFPDFNRIHCWRIQENYQEVFWRLPTYLPSEPTVIYQESGKEFPIPPHPNMTLRGFFMSPKYFDHHREKILALFAPKREILDYLHEKYSDLLDHPITVGVHVRTYIPDYGHPPTEDELHAFASISYYEEAISLFPEEALFLICSDDIPWCKAHLGHIAKNVVFIEGNKHYHDLYLMSLCDHNITANSTYSWWSAYLNQNPDKIVTTPDNWFGKWWGHNTDRIIPDGWIRIKRGKI